MRSTGRPPTRPRPGGAWFILRHHAFTIMPESTPAPAASTQKQLQLKRDAALRERFAHLYKKKRMRHDDVLKQLEEEFFITERTIRGIIKATPPAATPTATALDTTARDGKIRSRFVNLYLGPAASAAHYVDVLAEIATEFGLTSDAVRTIVDKRTRHGALPPL